jgi:glycosyltransferase involved in cell wall biosynthesis
VQQDPPSQRLSICLVTHVLQRQDGQGRVNFEVARAVLARGHRLTMVAMRCADELLQHPNATFIQMGGDSLPSQLLRNHDFAQKSARWLGIHRQEFDVIQANGFVTWAAADVVAVHFVHTAWLASPSFPFSVFSRKPRDWYQRIYTLLNARWELQAFRQAQEIVAVSRRTAAEVEGMGPFRAPVNVIYNGVDLEEFYPGTPCREVFGLPSDKVLALFVGDIRTPRKNLPTVLKAMLSLPDVHLAVAAAKEGSPYPQQAESMGLGDRVHFLGKTSRVADLMRSADFMVFPSRYEAHPLVVLEAMASGLPTIVSSVIAEGESFSHACVLLKDADDEVVLAEEMRSLAETPALRRDLAERGRVAASQLSWKATGSAYVSLYERMTAQKE